MGVSDRKTLAARTVKAESIDRTCATTQDISACLRGTMSTKVLTSQSEQEGESGTLPRKISKNIFSLAPLPSTPLLLAPTSPYVHGSTLRGEKEVWTGTMGR